MGVIACGALGGHIREIAARRGWLIELHFACPRCCTTGRTGSRLPPSGWPASCSSGGCGWRSVMPTAAAMGPWDELCQRLGLRRLPGLHCYDVLAGPDRVGAMLAAEAENVRT